MLKKTIEYTDFDGNDVREDFYFNLTKAELIELQVSAPGDEGFMGVLSDAVRRQDKMEIVKFVKLLIGKSYGLRSEDGRSFHKREEFTEAFYASEAYSSLLVGLLSEGNEKEAQDFINGIMPKALVEQANVLMEQQKITSIDLPESVTITPETKLEVVKTYTTVAESDLPAWQREGRLPTKSEIQKMSPDEIVLAMQAKVASK